MFIINDNTRPLTKALLFAMLFLPICLFAQQKHALLIGISDYPQYEYADASWDPIHGTNDVHLISPILAKQGFSIDVLLNEAATHKAIENGLEKLGRDVQPGDIVYIHLSGHGQAVEDEDGDEADGWDEAFIPYDAERSYREEGYHGENHLLDDELNGYLNVIRRKAGENGIVYVVIDACHAGSSARDVEDEDTIYIRGTEIGFSKSGKTYDLPRDKRDKRGNIRVYSEKGMARICILEACRSDETNAEIKQNGYYYGPLSYYTSQQLLTMPLSFDTNWTEDVRVNMKKDQRLRIQHMVIESSE